MAYGPPKRCATMNTSQQHRNEVHLRGVLVRNPDIRYTASGKPVANFTVLTAHEKRTEYHRCVAWEKVAEYLGEHFKKGSFLALAGPSPDSHLEKDGQRRYITEIVVWNVNDGNNEKPPLTPNLERNLHGVQGTDDDIPGLTLWRKLKGRCLVPCCLTILSCQALRR